MKPTARIDFSKPLRPWDGFGVNYVEVSQTRDYANQPQEYGGFSYLSETQRQEIIDLTFGEDGLKPGLVKMFQDCWQQAEPGPGYNYDPSVSDPSSYDHETTTQWMRYFVREGLKLTRQRGDDLAIVTALYGPPAWMTQQKIVRGRDIDPALKTEVAKYMIAWTKWLREAEGFPVQYISLHNEGEDWLRWPLDGDGPGSADHDYNLYWPPEQVADFIKFMPSMLQAQGLDEVGVTPGETSNWYRFHSWGYADAIVDDPEALRNLGLITSHGFYGMDHHSEWFGDWRSIGIDSLREQRPELHTWVTSTSWSQMDVFFVNEIRNSIYSAKVNGIIPWATIQLQGHWEGGDPNPGTAFKVWDDGRYEIAAGYYYYKQVCRAGQAGMQVCKVAVNDHKSGLIAFGSGDSDSPESFVLLNLWDREQGFDLEVLGSSSEAFCAYRTGPEEQYIKLADLRLEDGRGSYTAPALSVTTFFAQSR